MARSCVSLPGGVLVVVSQTETKCVSICAYIAGSKAAPGNHPLQISRQTERNARASVLSRLLHAARYGRTRRLLERCHVRASRSEQFRGAGVVHDATREQRGSQA